VFFGREHSDWHEKKKNAGVIGCFDDPDSAEYVAHDLNEKTQKR